MTRPFASTFFAFAFALVSGCASSPQSNFYTLSPELATDTSSAGRSPKAIVVLPVSVPEVVDRPQFVLRVNENKVSLDEFARWADPLKSQVRRVLTTDLALQFPGALVSGSPQNADLAMTFLVSLDGGAEFAAFSPFTDSSITAGGNSVRSRSISAMRSSSVASSRICVTVRAGSSRR